MLFKRKLLIPFCLLLSSCGSVSKNPPKYIEDENIFSQYLTRQFNIPLAKDSTNYIIVSESSCSGCTENSLKSLRSLQKTKKSKIILNQVSYYKLKNGNDFQVDEDYIIDSNNEINHLKYGTNNICVIQAFNSKIYNVVCNITSSNEVALLK